MFQMALKTVFEIIISSFPGYVVRNEKICVYTDKSLIFTSQEFYFFLDIFNFFVGNS